MLTQLLRYGEFRTITVCTVKLYQRKHHMTRNVIIGLNSKTNFPHYLAGSEHQRLRSRTPRRHWQGTVRGARRGHGRLSGLKWNVRGFEGQRGEERYYGEGEYDELKFLLKKPFPLSAFLRMQGAIRAIK